ncbi:MAG: signal recognition particle-docking protein FtsY [Pseudomonadota bacterium]
MNDTSKKPGFFKRMRARLNQGDSWLTYDLANLVPGGKIDDDVLEELEARLVMADVGIDTTERILEQLRKRLARNELKDAAALLQGLEETLTDLLEPVAKPLVIGTDRPFVILMVGVNGAGKTTTLGKLAQQYKSAGHSVLLAAGDTFRAAAIEQLQVWGERNDVPVIAQQTGSDPAAVLFDAHQAATARSADILLADTAGRLHSQEGLMAELEKVQRVLGRADENAPHEVLLVLDAGLGQNALTQAREFNKALGVTGLVVTKLDGTAKGGVVFAIAAELGIPIRYIGIGEKLEDLAPFNANEFVRALMKNDGNERT